MKLGDLMKNLLNYTKAELTDLLVQNDFKAFSAKQIFQWIYQKNVTDFSQMTNLSKKLRGYLQDNFVISKPTISSRQISADGTEKYLLKLADGNIIETVLMRHNYGRSVCVTTQLGCNMACSFCASGLQKKQRDLNAGEIVSQVLTIQQTINERVSHVVVMGIGEPFDNYEETIRFIDIINDPFGLEIGARHITVSTSGIIPRIYDFARETKQVNLAISLHAPSNTLRSSLMPINKKYPIEKLIKALKHYIKMTNRRVTFEYILLDGVNDSLDDAQELVKLISGMNVYVNLIRYNPVSEFSYKGTSEKKAKAFHHYLMSNGITATLRREKGGDIDAACGQLRAKKLFKLK
jgi:23S rRNA (adenine2503-C2)-methyltransferase